MLSRARKVVTAALRLEPTARWQPMLDAVTEADLD